MSRRPGRGVSRVPRPRLPRGLWLLPVLLLAGGVGWLVWVVGAVSAPPEVSDGASQVPTVELHIPRGATGREIVGLLGEAGLAPHPEVTYWTLRLGGTLHRVEAGVHVLPADASPRALVDLLRRPATRARVELTLIPGETVWQAAARIEAAGLGDASEVIRRAADREYVVDRLGLPAGPVRPPRPDGVPATYLEGFLYPDTYFLAADATVDEALAAATGRFKRVWGELLARRKTDVAALRERYGVGPRELIIIASLVEEEAQLVAEGPRIAGVFFNRLARPMRLQTDPTLRYHPERVGRPPTPADRRDRSNPYNTYAYDGLPPGPISSPDRRGLAAALTPERHDYLFFVATRDGRGTHAFATTLAEHDANIERYLR